MLRLVGSSGNEWRPQLCAQLPSGCDTVDDEEVRAAFVKGIEWADAENIPHKRKDPNHYADQYLRSVRQGEPIIPLFMRLYCATMNGTKFTDDRPAPMATQTASPTAETRPLASLDSRTKPSRAPLLRSPAFARS